MMWGKHFESMYEGSMYGAGVAVFAVWGYVISKARKGTVELNPRKLADTLGGTVEQITEAIEYLMRPDPHSRWKTHEGRRLLKEGEYLYRMPSWEYYQTLRNEEERREYNRAKQAEYRERLKMIESFTPEERKAYEKAMRKERRQHRRTPLPGETSYERGVNNGAICPECEGSIPCDCHHENLPANG